MVEYDVGRAAVGQQHGQAGAVAGAPDGCAVRGDDAGAIGSLAHRSLHHVRQKVKAGLEDVRVAANHEVA